VKLRSVGVGHGRDVTVPELSTHRAAASQYFRCQALVQFVAHDCRPSVFVPRPKKKVPYLAEPLLHATPWDKKVPGQIPLDLGLSGWRRWDSNPRTS
jgi:hypothetical protein